MIDRILLILADNAAGLTPTQLLGALGVDAFPRDDLGTLIADGRAVLDTTSGVDVYRLGAPVAVTPKPKAAPTSRMVPIALLDALAEAVGVARGSQLTEIVEAVRASIMRGERMEALAALAHGTSAPSTAYVPPAPWVAAYSLDDGKSYAKVTASGKRWDWAVDDGGTGDVATLEQAIRCADAVRAVVAS